MKTLYLKQKKSGNYEIVNNAKEATIKFVTKKSFIDWFNSKCNGYTKYRSSFGSRIIKATYRLSQTYYSSAEEVLMNHLK